MSPSDNVGFSSLVYPSSLVKAVITIQGQRFARDFDSIDFPSIETFPLVKVGLCFGHTYFNLKA